MAKKIKFPLEMRDGVQVRNIEELRENFDIEKALGYLLDGKLVTWLEDRYYIQESEEIRKLDVYAPDVKEKIGTILGVEIEVEAEGIDVGNIEKKNEKLTKIKQYTDDEAIWSKVDSIAFSQEELDKLLKSDYTEIYLCGDEFCISAIEKKIKFIGINSPIITIKDIDVVFVLSNNDIVFENICFDKGVLKKTEEIYYERKYDIVYKMFLKLSENGVGMACLHLADYYMLGYNVVRVDGDKMKEYRKKAYQCGNEIVRILTSIDNEIDISMKEVEKLREYVLKSGHPKAQGLLGNLSFYGNGEVKKDYKEALKWYSKGMENGDVNSWHQIAYAYFHGFGVEKDDDKAVEMMKDLAELGVAASQYMLGYIYENSSIVKNCKEAVRWYEKAVKQNHLYAIYSLGVCYDDGRGVEQNYRKAVELYEKGANMGDESCQNCLSRMYWHGHGVEKNHLKAKEWGEKALATKPESNVITRNLATIYYEGDSTVRDRSKAKELLKNASGRGDSEAAELLREWF